MPHRKALDRVWTVLDLIKWGTDYFSRREIDSPRLTIELLLCDVLKTSRIQLYADFERPVTSDELAVLRSYVTRRAHHEPLQYITGVAHFYSLEFAVNPNVLIPRQETELLVDHAIRWINSVNKPIVRGLDIGTGSGCIPLAIAHHAKNSTWLGVDIDPKAIEVAEHNSLLLGMSERVQWRVQDFLASQPDELFDLITMNPPYIPQAEVPTLEEEVRGFEPHRALTDDGDGTAFYRRLAQYAHQMLLPGGSLFLELGWRGGDVIPPLFESVGATRVVDDLQDIPRILIVQR